MKEKTDLASVKSVAVSLLMTDYHKTKMSPVVIQHPFTNTGFVQAEKDGIVQLVDITKSDADFKSWQTRMRGLIEKADNPYLIYMMCNKPYGLTFLKFAMPHLSCEDFSKILSDAWIRSENPNSDPNLSTAKLLTMFRAADIAILMDDKERAELAGLDDTVTIYRGLTSHNAKNIKAMSWTLNYDTASWFAHRFDEDGTVYEASIDKSNILALFNGRNESEIIVDPKHLMDITEAEEPVAGMSITQ